MTLEQFRKSDIILVCGLPGSGKSHFSRKYFMKSGSKRVSRKEIRMHLYEMMNFGAKWSEDKFDLVDETLVKHIERKLIEHLLQMGESIILDNMSLSSSSREPYITVAKRMKKNISAIFMDTDTATCLKRNREREPGDMVPEKIIANLAAGIEYPERREGLSEVLVLKNYEETLSAD
ncbi:MAG: ATP-binding protein [Spirochaetia bacterium]|jgi:predicted kinase|nr:ATP-binding protein [Spirochaetia bacterium]